MMVKIFVAVVLLFCAIGVKCDIVDYYWKDFNGAIPGDALQAGRNAEGRDIYIGQAYIQNYGLFVGEIFAGQNYMDVQCYGVKRVESRIKILCTSNKNSFSWLPTHLDTFLKDTENKYVVAGGQNHNEETPGVLHIGRVIYEGATHIGAIASHHKEKAEFYFVHDGKQRSNNDYEALIYKQ